MRSPEGALTSGGTQLTTAWKPDDANWTDALVAQVPYGIDPRTSNTAPNGIFVLSRDAAWGENGEDRCAYEMDFANEQSWFSNDWYDKINAPDNGEEWIVYAKMPPAPADMTEIIFTVETYWYNIIPKKCTEGTYTYDDGSVETHFSPKYNYSVKR